MFLDNNIIGNGRIMTISMSKIKKIIEIKKNLMENGIRDKEKGSNPHSNGDIFSLSSVFLGDINNDKKEIRKGIKKIVIIFIV